LRGNWQDYYRQDALRGHSAIAELLVLVYVNDIYKAIPNTDIRLFADDTNVFVHEKNLDSVAAEANAVLLKLNNWFLANKLSLSILVTRSSRT